ncbi:hypothetical protein OE88DRAFT_813243 [Heliocybe sulcata]|uniref:Secreted protein n=1 Tax=Heliocybe sulcata TaxID=5364 RepID=A0A5C3MQ80_9AGAM|nr:hypothetical protein OE88DRAFT_813243 [Heliocybe sulcata]
MRVPHIADSFLMLALAPTGVSSVTTWLLPPGMTSKWWAMQGLGSWAVNDRHSSCQGRLWTIVSRNKRLLSMHVEYTARIYQSSTETSPLLSPFDNWYARCPNHHEDTRNGTSERRTDWSQGEKATPYRRWRYSKSRSPEVRKDIA